MYWRWTDRWTNERTIFKSLFHSGSYICETMKSSSVILSRFHDLLTVLMHVSSVMLKQVVRGPALPCWTGKIKSCYIPNRVRPIVHDLTPWIILHLIFETCFSKTWLITQTNLEKICYLREKRIDPKGMRQIPCNIMPLSNDKNTVMTW